MHLIDGGLSTELERLGAVIEGELWTGKTLLQDPQLVQQAHRNFVEAGAEIIITASYQISRQGFEEIGLKAEDAVNALRNSVAIAFQATAGTSCKVAASVGPFGAVLHDGSEYRGDYKVSQNQLEDFHAERMEVLLSAKPDLLAVETIPNILEAKALRNVLQDVRIPFWFSFTAGEKTKLWSGEPIEEAAGVISGLENLIAAGVNCVDPELVLPLVTSINRVTQIPSIAYPNCGGLWDTATNQWLGAHRRKLVEWLEIWKDSPIEWIGGCCGTDSKDISELRRAIDESL